MILTRDGKEIVAIYKQDGSEVDEVKDANGRLIYTASREITGTLPLPFSGRGKPLTDYLISGNTIQNGTPTPEAPVDVVGCGVRTGNLWNEDYPKISEIAKYSPVKVGNGEFTLSSTVSKSGSSGGTAAVLFLLAGNVSSGISTNTNGVWDGQSRTVNAIDGYVTVAYRMYTSANPVDSNTMLNLGSEPLTYEPYGYKLPLTIGGTEFPIFLGEVQTTRKIKKLVLTGEEGWTITSNGVLRIGLSGQLRPSTPLCTHYLGSNSSAWSNVPDKSVTVSISGYLAILDTTYTTAADFKSYLAAQYAAGTPVTVWYVLAEPETAVVNEPLHKIGDYADTITMAQSGVTIPTMRGTNVLDMTTPVKPSEVYIKGKGIKSIT